MAKDHPPLPLPPGEGRGEGAGQRLLKRATTVSLLTAVGVVAGFLVDVLLVARFGISARTDAYFGAYTVPLILVTSVTAVSPVLVTILAGYRGDESAFSVLLNATGLLALGVAGLGALAAHPLVAVITPGFAPATAAQAVSLARILFASVPATALAEVCKAELYTRQRFGLATFSNALPSLFTVLALIVPGTGWGIESVAIGLVIGSAAQALLVMGALFFGFRLPYRATLRHSTPILSQTARLIWAPLAGLLLRQGVTLAERFFGSRLAAGSVTALSYASRLTMTVAGVAYDGIAVASLPSLAERWTKGPAQAARAELAALVKLMVTVAVPVGLTVAALGTPLVLILFERGQLGHQQALFMGLVLSVYSLSLVSLGPFRAAQNFFYAIRDMRPIVLLLGGLAVLTVLLDWILMRSLGAVGLALSFATSAGIIAVASGVWLARRSGVSLGGSTSSFWRLCLVSLATAGAAFGTDRWLQSVLSGHGRFGLVVSLALAGLAALAAFVAAGSVVRLEVLSMVKNMAAEQWTKHIRSR